MKTEFHIPRLVFTAPYSSGGKTTLACGFLRVLDRRGLNPCAFKCGPDYVDAAYHKATLKRETANIDLFFCGGPHLARALVAEGARGAGAAVIEGVMGFYDGAGGISPASSTWDMAARLKAPAILIIHARGITQTASALAAGLNTFRAPSGLAGVVLNCCRPTLYQKLAGLIEKDTGLKVLGYLPPDDVYQFKSRNLGLYMPGEMADFEGRVEALADQMEKTLDIEALLSIARAAPPLSAAPLAEPTPAAENLPIAVARDEAFAFYYDENLSLLRKLGAQLIPFSPLRDRELPPPARGLYLGGGYIEFYAKELAANESMRRSVGRAFERGLVTLAEGGGFLYLGREIVDENGQSRPMAGALPGRGARGDKRARFGYVTLAAQKDNLLCDKGQTIAAHEFHEWDSDSPGHDFLAQKPADDRHWLAGVSGETFYAGFPQMYFYNNPDFPRRFIKKAAEAA